MDDIVDLVISLNGKCVLYEIGLQQAFRPLKLDPGDIKYTGLYVNEQYYIDTSGTLPGIFIWI